MLPNYVTWLILLILICIQIRICTATFGESRSRASQGLSRQLVSNLPKDFKLKTLPGWLTGWLADWLAGGGKKVFNMCRTISS